MSMTAQDADPSPDPSRRRSSGGPSKRRTSGLGQIQSILGIVMVVLLALAPLPLGSNRPVFWALGAVVLGIVATVYFATLTSRGQTLRVSAPWMRTAIGFGSLYLGWIVVQILPLGLLTGGFETTLPSGLVVQHNTLSLTPGAGILAAVRVAGYGLLFLLVLQLAGNRDRSKTIAQALFFMVTAWALYALLALIQLEDTILFFEKWAYLGSATGPFVNRNSFATFLAMGLVTGLGLVADRATRHSNGTARGGDLSNSGTLTQLTNPSSMHVYLMGLMALIVLATLFQTNSRMGVFAGLIGSGLTLALITTRRLNMGRKGLLIVPPVLLLIGGVVAWNYGGVLFDRIGDVEQNANVRLSLYRQVLDMIAQRPWTGWGADSFEATYRAFRAAPVSVEFSWTRAHSTYLAHWVETGVVFGSIPMILLGWAFVACLRAAIQRDTDIVLPAIGAGVILTGALHSVVDFSLEMQANTWLFLALLALALGGHRPGATRARTKAAKTQADAPAAPDTGPQPGPNSDKKRRRRRRRG